MTGSLQHYVMFSLKKELLNLKWLIGNDQPLGNIFWIGLGVCDFTKGKKEGYDQYWMQSWYAQYESDF